VNRVVLLSFACCLGCSEAAAPDPEPTESVEQADGSVEPLGCESEWTDCSPEIGCGDHAVCMAYGGWRVQPTSSTAAGSVGKGDAMAPDASMPPSCEPGSFSGQLYETLPRYPLIGPEFDIGGEIEFDVVPSGGGGLMVERADVRVLETNFCAYSAPLELIDSSVMCGADGLMVHLELRAPGAARPALSLMATGDGELIGQLTYETWCVLPGTG
jgi:hypothetical protein